MIFFRSAEERALWEAWVAERPPHIQQAIRDYPPGSTFQNGDERLYLMGWAEGEDTTHVTLLFSTVDPGVDYDEARKEENVRRICRHHVRPVTDG